jgi:release factor H-coupled RctB family protein
MGNCIQSVADGVSLIASDDTWIEQDAIQQLIKTSQLTGVTRAVGLPDLHPGRGYPVGAAFLTENIIYPALVGNDIGCGMALWNTELSAKKIKRERLEKQLGSIDDALDVAWDDLLANRAAELGVQLDTYRQVIGTIGGGNHFAELLQIDHISDHTVIEQMQLDQNSLCLLVHSGSRGLGEAILRSHVDQFSHAGLSTDSEAFTRYIAQHDHALSFAALNREFIARRILDRLRSQGECQLDVHHNLVERYAEEGWIHRKGVNPADKGLVMLPGSRGDYSYLLRPTQSPDSLLSLAHGAGRKWKRSDCKGRLTNRYKVEDLNRTQFGSIVVCKDRELIFEEAPQAYKSVQTVLDSMVSAGLVDVVARFKPVLTYKTRGKQGC